MAAIKPIETEKEFEENLARLISAAEEIEHPLITDELKIKYQNAYDRIAGHIDDYRIRDFARKFSYMHEFYKEQGRIGKDEVL